MDCQKVVHHAARLIFDEINKLGGVPPEFLDGWLHVTPIHQHSYLHIEFRIKDRAISQAVTQELLTDHANPGLMLFDLVFKLVHEMAKELLPMTDVARIRALHWKLRQYVKKLYHTQAYKTVTVIDDMYQKLYYGEFPSPKPVPPPLPKVVQFYEIGEMLVPPDLAQDLI